MPKIACRACGRQIYTVAPVEALFPEERRCPRCGALMDHDRRLLDRRVRDRRANPPQNPGPPAGLPDRRRGERRAGRRRMGDGQGGS